MNLLAVIELFPTRALGAFCVALGLVCVCVAVGCALSEQLQRWASGLLVRFLALSPLNKAMFLLFFGVFVVYGSTKTNQVDQTSGTNEVGQTKVEAAPPPLGLNGEFRFLTSGEGAASTLCTDSTMGAASTLEWQPVGGSVVRAEALYRCGATEDALRLAFGGDFVFPDGTNHLDRVVILSSGEVRRSLQDRDALVRFGERLWSRPYDSELTAEHTPSNSYRLVWRNFYANGDTNLPRTVSAELFRNGDLAVTENGVTALAPYVIPFPHDGFGQDDDWVRANCTNAAEVLSVGYPQWVDDQVGVGLENGLYKFTATFPDDPPEATRLFVGDQSVCVTNAGEYVFLLEKGVEYEFGTVPYCSNVTYRAEDDIPVARPLLMFYGVWWYSDWSIDGGASLFELPTLIRFGRCSWMPTFQATPTMGHLGPGDSPRIFTAVLSDYAYAQNVSYHWSSTDPNVVISSPNARETEIGVRTFPPWGTASVTATASLGTNLLMSVCDFSYGEESISSVSVGFSRNAVFYEDSYTNSYGELVVGRSDSVVLTCEAHGGVHGGRVNMVLRDGGRLNIVGDVQMPCEFSVGPGEIKLFSITCYGVLPSETLGDVTAAATFVEDNTDIRHDDGDAITVVKVSTWVGSAWIPYPNRREIGVGESAIVYTIPDERELSLTIEGCTYTNEQWLYNSASRASENDIVLACQGDTFRVHFATIEPAYVEAVACYASSTEEVGVAGGLRCDFSLCMFPTNVSFAGIETAELSRTATNAVGFFAKPELSYLLNHEGHGGGRWHGFMRRNAFFDTASVSAINQDWGEGGSFTYPIPRAWRLPRTGMTNELPHRLSYDQQIELEENGTIRIKKFDYTAERTTNGVVTISKEVR